MSRTCYYTGLALPLNAEGKDHTQCTKALKREIRKALSSESNHRAFIHQFTALASNDPDIVMLAAYGLCGLRAVRIQESGVAVHHQPGMKRKIFREKTRLAHKLAVRSLALVHNIRPKNNNPDKCYLNLSMQRIQ